MVSRVFVSLVFGVSLGASIQLSALCCLLFGTHKFKGYIRLKRVDPSTVPDPIKDDCGIDRTPADGAACTKDKNGHKIVPPPVRVCGTSGILFDSFVPIGGRLLPTPGSSGRSENAMNDAIVTSIEQQ